MSRVMLQVSATVIVNTDEVDEDRARQILGEHFTNAAHAASHALRGRAACPAGELTLTP